MGYKVVSFTVVLIYIYIYQFARQMLIHKLVQMRIHGG